MARRADAGVEFLGRAAQRTPPHQLGGLWESCHSPITNPKISPRICTNPVVMPVDGGGGRVPPVLYSPRGYATAVWAGSWRNCVSGRHNNCLGPFRFFLFPFVIAWVVALKTWSMLIINGLMHDKINAWNVHDMLFAQENSDSHANKTVLCTSVAFA